MQIVRHTIVLIATALMLALSTNGFCAESVTFTPTEQEVLVALLSQQTETKSFRLHCIKDTASIDDLAHERERPAFSNHRREYAKNRDVALKEALDAFLEKSISDTKIVFSTNKPKNIQLISDDLVERIFRNNTNNNGWTQFYKQFPGSSGLTTVSRVGIDSKNTAAVIYFGKQISNSAGKGRIYVLRHREGKWVLTNESLGLSWHFPGNPSL